MRFLEIDDETVKVLQNWRTVQVYNREDNFVLARFNSPMNKSTLSRMLKRHALVAKVPVITGKGLRHSHDSFMINVLKKRCFVCLGSFRKNGQSYNSKHLFSFL